jgi:hypothetical protein
MATTTNYNWTTPDDTDLVKDGAAAIRTLGTAIDTTVFTNAGAAINKTIIDAAGDLIYGTADDTADRLAIGTAGQVLTVNSGATAPEWATTAAGGMTLISTTTLSGASVVLSSIPQTYVKLQLLIVGMTGNTSNARLRVLPNGSSSLSDATVMLNSSLDSYTSSEIQLCTNDDTLRTNADNAFNVIIENYNSTTRFKLFQTQSFFKNSGSTNHKKFTSGCFRSNTAITSLTLDYGGTNTFAGGTALLYGVK